MVRDGYAYVQSRLGLKVYPPAKQGYEIPDCLFLVYIGKAMRMQQDFGSKGIVGL